MRTSSSAVSSASRSAPSLTERSALELARGIRASEFSAREVVDAHIALAQRGQSRINAIVKDRYEEARADADAADARVAAGEEDLPPLLGVPCTVKESIALEGMPQVVGVVARRHVVSTETAPAAQRLIDAGAIPIGVTNTSEMTLWIESENRVYGRTSTPYDPGRMAGGSSGGEGAIVGSGASPIGLGSDIGGSIRIPAFCCGVFGHKPTPGLISLDGMWPNAPEGAARAMLVNGPLCRRAEDLMPTMEVLKDDGVELGDPDEVDLSGLRVLLPEKALLGRVSPDLLAARERAAGALAAAGATLEPVELGHRAAILEPYLAALSDAGVTLAEVLA
nr:amidase [Thermoleophilaceae bacterium]